MKPVCPFAKASTKSEAAESAAVGPKCPFGYDTETFKLGPFSCLICRALLYETTKCVPCSHVFCKACVSRFKDCPLCGADIDAFEPDTTLQTTVDRFIQGHARINRSIGDRGKEEDNNNKVIYADVSLERGAFLVQQAMRAFHSQNIESAKSRLSMCAEDIRDQLERMGNTSELCSQLGAVLGMLGDCSRAKGDASSAMRYFEESVEYLTKIPMEDLEITHTLSVSLNKIGDLKYYGGDLQAARSYYFRCLNVRRDATNSHLDVPSLILDLAVSLAKVADVDRNLGNENVAISGFEEGIKLLESLEVKSEDSSVEQRRLSVLEFLRDQLAEKRPDEPK